MPRIPKPQGSGRVLIALRDSRAKGPPATTAYISLVHSCAEYGAAIWDPYLAKDIKALERIQNCAIRWVSGNGPREPTSISQLRQDLKWPTLEKRRQNIRLTYMYKIIHEDIAVHPEHLGMQQSDSRTRAKHKYKMRELPARTDDLKHSFVNRTIPQWNCLLASVAEADSAIACKNLLAALLD